MSEKLLSMISSVLELYCFHLMILQHRRIVIASALLSIIVVHHSNAQKNTIESDRDEIIKSAEELNQGKNPSLILLKTDSVRVCRKLRKQIKSEGEVRLKPAIEKVTDSLRGHYGLGVVEGLPEPKLIASRENLETSAMEIVSDQLENKYSQKELEEYRAQIEQHTGDLSKVRAFADNPDSLWSYVKSQAQNMEEILEEKALQMDEVQLFEEEMAALKANMDLPNQYYSQLQRYQEMANDPAAMKGQAIEAAVGLANKVMEAHQGTLNTSMNKLNKLKKKYTYVPDNTNLETATKRSSMKEEPLRKRLNLGGSFQLNFGNPTTMDFNPQITYKINRNIILGSGGTYRVSFKVNEQVAVTIPQNVYGYRAFLEGRVYKSFFLHGEFENMSTDIFDQNQDIIGRSWVSGAMAGIAKSFNLSPTMGGGAQILYNFLHNENSPYASPWIFRFGISFTGEKHPRKKMLEKLEQQAGN